MEIENIIKGLKTAKDKIEKEINFLQSVDITSGAECCELYIKENGLEFIADEIREAYHAGYIKACRKNDRGTARTTPLRVGNQRRRMRGLRAAIF